MRAPTYGKFCGFVVVVVVIIIVVVVVLVADWDPPEQGSVTSTLISSLVWRVFILAVVCSGCNNPNQGQFPPRQGKLS